MPHAAIVRFVQFDQHVLIELLNFFLGGTACFDEQGHQLVISDFGIAIAIGPVLGVYGTVQAVPTCADCLVSKEMIAVYDLFHSRGRDVLPREWKS
jgi:hypothetical protein